MAEGLQDTALAPAAAPAAADQVPFGYFQSMGHLYRLANPYPTPEMPHGSTEIHPEDMAAFMAGQETPWQKAGNIPGIARGKDTGALGAVAPQGAAPTPGGPPRPAVTAAATPNAAQPSAAPGPGLLATIFSGMPQAQAAEAPQNGGGAPSLDPAKFGLGPAIQATTPVAATAAAHGAAPVLDPAKFGLGAPVTTPRPPPAPVDQGMAMNIAAGLNKGLTGFVGLPVEAATAVLNLVPHAINALAGTNIPTIENPVGGSHSLNQLLGLVGATNPETVQPATPAETYAQAIGQGVAGAALPAVGAEAAAGRIGAGIAKTVLEHIAEKKALQAVGGATGGAAGQAAEEAAPEPLKPLANLSGNVAGAAAGMAALPLAKAAAVRLPGAPIISEAARQHVVARNLKEAVGNAPIETSPVGPLDLAQATNQPAVAGKVDYAEGIPEGSTEAASLRASQRSSVDNAIREIGGGRVATRPDSSAEFTRFYRQISDLTDKEAGRLWTKPELAETTVNPSAVQQAVADAEKAIEPELHAAMSPELRAILGRLTRSKETTMRDLNRIRSDLLKVARGNPDGGQRAMARDLAQGFMKGLDETPELKDNPAIAAAYKAARDFTRRMNEMFADRRSAALLNEARGEYTTDESAGAQKFFNLSYGTPEGPRTIAELAAFARTLSHQPGAAAAADGLLDTARAYFAAALADAARLGPGRTFSPAALRQLLDKNLPWIESEGVFTPAQTQMARDLLQYTEMLDRTRENMTQRGSHTNRRGEQANTFVDRIMHPWLRRAGELAATVGAGTTHGPFGVAAGATASYFFDRAVSRAETQLRELMSRAVLDPEFAAQLMKRPTVANAARMAPAASSVLDRMEKDAEAFRGEQPPGGGEPGGGGSAPPIQPSPSGGGAAGERGAGNRRTEPTLGPAGVPGGPSPGAGGPGGGGSPGGVAAASPAAAVGELGPVLTEARPGATLAAYTPRGTRIDLRPEVVDLSKITASNAADGRINPRYPKELQPRDRSQAASQAQIATMAGNLRPEMLMPSADSTAGAPIIGPNGAVESGNGRTMALTRILTEPRYAQQRAAYLRALQDAGYSTEGIANPVLVSRRVSDLSPEELRRFTIEANDRTTLAMSEAEQARADAQRAASAMPMWQGKSPTSPANREFVRAFLNSLPPTEQAELAPNGILSPAGIDRINRAVMAHAYGDAMGGTLDRFLNSDSEGLKAVAGALQEVAGPWAQMRARAASGAIPSGLDPTKALGEAVDALAEARRLNRPVSEVIAQTDFTKPPISADGAAFLRAMFRDNGMRAPAGRQAVADFLAKYAAKAEQQTPRIVGDAPKTTPTEILDEMNGNAPGQPPLFRRGEPTPLYSALERAAGGLKQAKGTGEQMLAALKKTPGVKPEELAWTGLEDWLKGQKAVTREQVADFLRENKVDVREVGHGAPLPLSPKNQARLQEIERQMEPLYKKWESGGIQSLSPDERMQLNNMLAERDRARQPAGTSGEARYQQYALPGGENYRELLLTLPEKEGDAAFRSSHWDEPNVLAHIRFDDRTAPDGAKVLMVHEVQSDWHQKGRREGYQGQAPMPAIWREWAQAHGLPEKEAADAINELSFSPGSSKVSERARELWNQWSREMMAFNRAVPNAPFKTSWSSLAMRRTIQYAVDHGYDRIAWSPGDVHAERYDLSHQIDALDYKKNPDGTYRLSYQKNGRGNLIGENIPEPKLEDHVGKDVAQKIVEGAGKDQNFAANNERPDVWKRMSGLDLKVGGEGMKGFYDRILPAEVNKIVGKFGAKVGPGEIGGGEGFAVRDPSGAVHPGFATEAEANNQRYVMADAAGRDHTDYQVVRAPAAPSKVHSFDITPKMREVVGTEGMPLFRVAEPVTAGAKLGQVHPDAVQAALDVANRITGGKIKVEVHDPQSDLFRVTFPDGKTENVFGYAFGRLVRAAAEGDRTLSNLGHESLHALVNLGVVKPTEWRALLRAARDGGWIEKYGVRDRYPGLSSEQHLEEAIADHFGQYVAKNAGKPPQGLVGRVAQNIQRYLIQVGRALRGRGFKNADDIFREMSSGKMGRRAVGSVAPVRGPVTPEASAAEFDQWRREQSAAASP